jgi:pimeloyl-ACP methyl ester carboxylesterase
MTRIGVAIALLFFLLIGLSPELGHNLIWEKPDAVAAVVLRFLSSTH